MISLTEKMMIFICVCERGVYNYVYLSINQTFDVARFVMPEIGNSLFL